ncbi:MAG TPA: hypothetical protein VNL77_24965 [Roseiflexaceae bacterium]|nr:hypothetical protein [Roseiflexaceae bacterium]
MLTVENIQEYLERVIAEYKLAGNRQGLRNLQTAAGFLMEAANAYGAKDVARRFHVLAAKAANEREELEEG